MADKKISELVNLTSLATDDEFVVVDKGANATKRITATNLSKFPSGVTVPDAGTIGSASDPDAMAISSGGVVTFSQGLSFGADTLDDYEEGTWTPVITGDSTAGSYTNGIEHDLFYRKVNDIVIISGLVGQWTQVSAGSGNMRLGGLPFPAAVNARLIGFCRVQNFSGSSDGVGALGKKNFGQSQDFAFVNDSSITTIDISNIGGTSLLFLSAIYRTA